MLTRRTFLAGLLALAAPPALAQRGVPPEIGRALSRHPKYRGARIVRVNQRRGARTASGTMYEVEVETPDRKRYLVYIEPGTGRVLADTGPLR
jgi:hypothetical protein